MIKHIHNFLFAIQPFFLKVFFSAPPPVCRTWEPVIIVALALSSHSLPSHSCHLIPAISFSAISFSAISFSAISFSAISFLLAQLLELACHRSSENWGSDSSLQLKIFLRSNLQPIFGTAIWQIAKRKYKAIASCHFPPFYDISPRVKISSQRPAVMCAFKTKPKSFAMYSSHRDLNFTHVTIFTPFLDLACFTSCCWLWYS